MPTWLVSFFQNAFAAVGPLGLAGFAMLVIVAIVAITANGRVIPAVVGALALLGVVGIAIFNEIRTTAPPQSISDAKTPPPAKPPTGDARWFDTGLQADWAADDAFYGAGERPAYEVNGRKLCDNGLLGRVATCWDARLADSKSMADGVPTNIDKTAGRRDWCAYKDNNISLSTRQNGGAVGRVYACALSIEP